DGSENDKRGKNCQCHHVESPPLTIDCLSMLALDWSAGPASAVIPADSQGRAATEVGSGKSAELGTGTSAAVGSAVVGLPCQQALAGRIGGQGRSEERRVGKEGRSGGGGVRYVRG